MLHGEGQVSIQSFRAAGDLLWEFQDLGESPDFTKDNLPAYSDDTVKKGMEIDTGTAAPIRSSPYPTSPEKRQIIASEVQTLVKKGICYRAASGWASPVVLVPKPDGTWKLHQRRIVQKWLRNNE